MSSARSTKPKVVDTSAPSVAASARDKVRSLEELARAADEVRRNGGKVVLCHGVFDLLHMGHVRHFEAARREGTALFVTLTADAFVNKGPGRPIFQDNMRAEMIAAVQYVDNVAINHAPTAENVLKAVRPDVYVKGSDYENSEADITGKIDAERATVEEYGGNLVFTKDITFSSSNLINKYLDIYDPPLRDYLDELRVDGRLPRLVDLIEQVKNARVLFVGDAIIDEYQYVSPMEKSPKENMVATLFKNRELFAGGVVAAANHAASFCAKVDVVTVLGSADSYEELIRQNLKPNVQLYPVYRDDAPTTRKCRFIDPNYMRKMFEVYHMDDAPCDPSLEARLSAIVSDLARNYDLVVVTDFGHGMITSRIIHVLTGASRFLAVNAQTNSANLGFNPITKYFKADFVCIDGREARLALSDKFSDVAVLAGEKLPGRIDCPKMIVTAGVHGCVTYERGRPVQRIPAFTKTVVDTVGAGDAFFAVTAPLVAAGGRMDDIGFIGNAAGAMKVGIVGHRSSVEKVPLIKFITTLLK